MLKKHCGFPLPLCPGGAKAGGLPQYLPLGWVDKGGSLPENLRLITRSDTRSQKTRLSGVGTQHQISDGMLVKRCGFGILT